MAEPIEADDVNAKRRRAKDLLKSVMAKLEEVEDERKQMVYRVDDLENLIWDQAENGGLMMTWERLESDRIARREEVVSKKRKRETEDGGLERPINVDARDALDQRRDPSGASLADSGGATGNEVEDLKSKVEDLERQLQALKGTQAEKSELVPLPPVGGITVISAVEIDLLRQQVKVVDETLQKLLSEREAWKQSVATACVTRFQAELQSKVGDLVKTVREDELRIFRRS
jgi:Trp operon repressor